MKKLSTAAAVTLAAGVAVAVGSGSSHREAPDIMLDPSADNTDTYAFTAKDAPDALTVVANWVPGGNPASGPNFFRFDDRARYYISIDNTGEGRADVRYRFTFKTQVSNETFLYARPGVRSIDDDRLIQKQRYTVVRETYRPNGKRRSARTIARGLPVAPSNAGPKTFPDYERVANEAIRNAGDTRLFVGQRNDAFFIDLGAAFDNINVRQGTGNTGGGLDTQSGTSVQTITMQIPERLVTRDRKPVAGPDADNATVGVWASTERRRFEVTNARFSSRRGRGGWVQVSRLGVPLINELFLPAGLKDRFNKLQPTKDDTFTKPFVLTPELAKQLNELAATGLGAPDTDRTDLVQALLTGMPGLNQIDKDDPRATDTLKINLGIPPTGTPNRFGVIGGDNAGFPNGRRLEDDAVDIVVQLAAGYLKGNRLPLGDGVDQDDKAFLETFPYQSVPDDGLENPVSDRAEPTHAPTAPGNNPPLPGGGGGPILGGPILGG